MVVCGQFHSSYYIIIFLTGYLKNMHHSEDKVFIIHVSELTHSGSIGKSHIDDSLFHDDKYMFFPLGLEHDIKCQNMEKHKLGENQISNIYQVIKFVQLSN